MSAMQYFTIAEYAFTKVNPTLPSLTAKLHINIVFEGVTAGVDIYLHKLDGSGVSHHKTGLQTMDQVDAYVTQLLVEADKTSVTA